MNTVHKERLIRVSVGELKAIRPLLSMTEERFNAVLAILDGATYQEAATQFGCSRQNIGTAVKQVIKTIDRYNEVVDAMNQVQVPHGFERVSMVLTRDHADIAKGWADEDKLQMLDFSG